ncbi:Rz1-like lysis system protein LysC [Aeromonas dhakensis]|uniref:Rz1-like lysis system protein LysC n=1 Tax=Aeromonas dhakensis TaxID=196024 RepID=UPI003BF7F8B3
MNRAALLSCLALLLCACASSPPPPLIKSEVVRLVPPASLTTPCLVPPLNLATWGAVVEEDMPALIAALRACDIRMTALRQWADSQKE